MPSQKRNTEQTGKRPGTFSGRILKRLAKVSANARVYVVDAELRGVVYAGKAGEIKTVCASDLTQRPNRRKRRKVAKK